MPREMGRRNPPAERKGCELPGGAGVPGQVWPDFDKSRRGRFSLALLAERLGSCASPGEDLYGTHAPCLAVPAEAAAGEGKLSSGGSSSSGCWSPSSLLNKPGRNVAGAQVGITWWERVSG